MNTPPATVTLVVDVPDLRSSVNTSEVPPVERPAKVTAVAWLPLIVTFFA